MDKIENYCCLQILKLVLQMFSRNFSSNFANFQSSGALILFTAYQNSRY